jgi:REP-associated tyrosine transposase
MPRPARFVLASTPHHVTQRGNHRQRVFFSDADHLAYLSWMREYTASHEVEVIGYCLMPNHVHLVLVPAVAALLPRMLQQLNARYAQRINRERKWIGHLWQGRYFCSVLDEAYFWAAMRYVELNPVRAGMVERAEDYQWSSARAHCGLHSDAALSCHPNWQSQIAGISDWSAWLQEGCAMEELEKLRTNAAKSLPCGSASFVESLEAAAGRNLRGRPRGRPRSKKGV